MQGSARCIIVAVPGPKWKSWLSSDVGVFRTGVIAKRIETSYPLGGIELL